MRECFIVEGHTCGAHQACALLWVVYVFGFVFAAQVSLVVNGQRVRLHRPALSALQQRQRDLPHHFNVLCLPLQPVGQQEPDSNKEIESFARRTYSVSFLMFSKIARHRHWCPPCLQVPDWCRVPQLAGQQKLLAEAGVTWGPFMPPSH